MKKRPRLSVKEALADETLAKAAAGDLDACVHLDALGLLIGPDESGPDYAERLRKLRGNIEELRTKLEEGPVEFYEFSLTRAERIREKAYQDAVSATWGLYDFAIHWVPGFYTNQGMGLLFAGCALYSYEDFFAVFVIRKGFQKKDRWLIYSRNELMAHELCHIARIGFHSRAFEEMFAYRTASSGFRKFIGGMLRSPLDSYLLAGGALSLLAVEYANIFLLTGPLQWLYAIPVGLFGYVLSRFGCGQTAFRLARRNLAKVFDSADALPVLFRCSDRDVYAIAACLRPSALQQWLHKRAAESLRWKVTLRRYNC
ncbi:MAG TPA: hypothetical protein DCR55_14475 [Lentisphaeria bacterium]|nr:hypothetical protein [Lentisphaeria bacterium]